MKVKKLSEFINEEQKYGDFDDSNDVNYRSFIYIVGNGTCILFTGSFWALQKRH